MKKAVQKLGASVQKPGKQVFLEQMDPLVPWSALVELITPLEKRKLSEQILVTVNELLALRGLRLKKGVAVDASLITAPTPGVDAVQVLAPSLAVEHSMSNREVEILHWVAHGKTNPEIGAILNISPFTVKNHMQHMFKKLNATNRAQAVAKFSAICSNA